MTSVFSETLLSIINLSSGSTALPPVMSTFGVFLPFSSACKYQDFIMMTLKRTLYTACPVSVLLGLNVKETCPSCETLCSNCCSPSLTDPLTLQSSTVGVISTNVGIYNEAKFTRQIVDGYFNDVRSILPVSGAAVPYLFMHNSSGVYGVNLDGAKMGQWQSSSTRISISDSYGINENPNGSPSTSPTLDQASKGSGGGGSAGIIGGVCAALVVVVAVLLFVFYHRKRRQLEKKDNGNVNVNTNTFQAPMSQHHPTGPSHLEGKFDVDPIPVEREMKLEVTGPRAAHPVPSNQDVYAHQQPQSIHTAGSISQGAMNDINNPAQFGLSPHVHAPHVSPAFTNTTPDIISTGHSGRVVPTFWEPRPFVPPARATNTTTAAPGQPPSSSTTPPPQIPSHSRPNFSGYGSP